MLSFLKYQFPAYLWAVLIFASSTMPTEFFARFNTLGPWTPKLVHILFFFFLCLFLYRAFRYQQSSLFLARWSLPMSLVVCLMFGSLDEVHQMFVLGRHPRLSDVLLDLSGATLMGTTIWIWDRYRTFRRDRIPS